MVDEFEPSIQDYINRLKYDPEPEVRQNAAWVLGRQRDNTVVEPLIAALEDEEAIVRVRVAEVLGNLKDSRVVPPLITALKDADEDVRGQAARSLGHAGDQQAVQHLLTLLNDPEATVRSYVVEALGLLKAADAAPQLVESLLNDEDEAVRYDAGRSLAAIGGEPCVSAMLNGLDQADDATVIMQMIEILAQTGDASTAEKLQPFTEHDDEGIRETAKWAVNLLKKKRRA